MQLPCYYFADLFSKYEPLFLSAKHENKSFPAGSFLSHPSSSFHTCYYIKSGLVRCYTLGDTGGKSIILQFYGPGSITPCYGEVHEFSVEPLLVIQAITETKTIAIPIPDFGKLLWKTPDLARDVLSYQIRQKNNVIARLQQLSNIGSHQLVCNMIYLLSTGESAFTINSTLSISQEFLANLCCLSRMQVTRVLKSLRKEGIITTHRNKIHILDMDALIQNCSYIANPN